MDQTLVVIGQATIDTSRGPLARGEYTRLPVVEALQLNHANKVFLADWHEQEMTVPDSTPKKGRYRRRDLRADR